MSGGVAITIQDNGLGQVSAGSGRTIVVIGTSSIGTANQPTATSNPQTLITTYGYGPGVEAAALIANQTGNPVIFIKAATNTAGTNFGIKYGSTNTSTVVPTVSGSPNDTYYALITVTTSGTIGTTGIQFTVSLDAGRTNTPVNLGTATSYVIPNTGLTLNLPSGTMNVGDTFSWVSTEPLTSDTFWASAIQSLYGFQTPFLNILLVGDAAAADVTSFGTQQTALQGRKQFAGMICNARDVIWGGASTETENTWMATIEANFVNTVQPYIAVAAGHYNVPSPISQIQYRRPLAWLAAVIDASQNLGQDWGQVTSGPNGPGGPITPITLPSAPDGYVYHNELIMPGLDAARFTSAQSYQGFPGLYIDNPNTMAGPGSDFNWMQRVEVVFEFCQVVYQFFTQQLSQAVPVNPTTGFILPAAAADLQNRCNAMLTATMVGSSPPACTAAYVVITTTNNILATSQLIVTGNIIPLGYIKSVPITVRFVNPANATAAVT